MNTSQNPIRELSDEEVASISGGFIQAAPYVPAGPASEFAWIPTEEVTHVIHF